MLINYFPATEKQSKGLAGASNQLKAENVKELPNFESLLYNVVRLAISGSIIKLINH